MSEYNFVSKFIASYGKNNGTYTAVQPRGKNQSTYADCEILYDNGIVKIEAKMFKDTRSNSAQFFNLLGEVLASDKKQSILANQVNSSTMCSAILVPLSSKGIFDNLWNKNISKDTGNIYCSKYKVKYLFAYDAINRTISVFSYRMSTNNWK